jgi:ubiquitin thioesterase OTU1
MAKLLKLQVKEADGKKHILEVAPETIFSAFQSQLEKLVKISPEKQSILAGFPPKELKADGNAVISTLIKSGEAITVKLSTGKVEMKQGTGGPAIFSIPQDTGVFRSRQMPADNSCMFHAAAFIFKKMASGAEVMQEMRNLIATEIAKDTSRYTTVILGSPNKTYCTMIKTPEIWGGAIELGVFSEEFKTEIVAFDVKACNETVYGGGKGYAQRCFLLYNGKHYDVLVFALQSAKDQTLFAATDQFAWNKARSYLETLHKEFNPSFKSKNWGSAGESKTSSSSSKPEPKKVGTVASTANWACSLCTFEGNKASDNKCTVCGEGMKPS